MSEIRMIGRLLPRALAITILLGSPAAGAGTGSTVSPIDPWIRDAPPGAPMAGYVRLENGEDRPRVLVGAHSSRFDRMMFHRSEVKDGVARMFHLPRLELEASGVISFEPGGLHLMLMGPEEGIAVGDEVTLTLEFADGERLPVVFVVRNPL